MAAVLVLMKVSREVLVEAEGRRELLVRAKQVNWS